MLIVDKNDDFYDHYSHIYGIDKQIVFDRKGSILLTDTSLFNHFYNMRISQRYFSLLEVGYKQYLFEFKDVKLTSPFNDPEYALDVIKVFDEQKHLFEKPMTIAPVSNTFYNAWQMFYNKNKMKKSVELRDITFENRNFDLPILKDTKLTKVLDAETIWKDLNVYISSQKNDKDVAIVNTDKDKIVNHGFDLKSSFRNPIK